MKLLVTIIFSFISVVARRIYFSFKHIHIFIVFEHELKVKKSVRVSKVLL